MLMLILFFILSVVVGGFLVLIINLFSWKMFLDLEKMSPFECGFNPKENSRLNFSLHFFLLTVIFLIFDVELVLLFPFLQVSSMTVAYSDLALVYGFIVLLTIGLFWEWFQMMLEWKEF